jgi:hypothetical protein
LLEKAGSKVELKFQHPCHARVAEPDPAHQALARR